MRDLAKKAGAARLSVVAGCLGALVLAGCGSSTSSSTSAGSTSSASVKGAKYTVGFTNPTAAQPILSSLADAIAARGSRLGVKVISIDDQLSITKQVSDIKTMIAEHVNGIIVYPLDGEAVIPALDEAKAKGIKILGLDALQGNASGQYTLSAPYQADETQGENDSAEAEVNYLAQKMGNKGNVVAIGLATPVPSVTYLMARIKADLASQHPNIKWLDEVYNQTDNESGGQAAMSQALGAHHGKINGVIAYNDDSAIGAATALKSSGVTGIPIVGRNGSSEGLQAVESGEISADENQEPYLQGATAMNIMYKLLKGESVPAFTQSNGVLATKSNVESQISWTEGVHEVSSGKIVGQDAG